MAHHSQHTIHLSSSAPRRTQPAQAASQSAPRRLFNPDQKDVLDTFLLDIPDVTAGKAFGYPIYAVGSNMFACLCGEGVALKLPQKVARRLIAKRDNITEFEPAPGKVWREWVMIVHESAADYMQDADLFQMAIEYAAAAEGAANGGSEGGSNGSTRGKKKAKG